MRTTVVVWLLVSCGGAARPPAARPPAAIATPPIAAAPAPAPAPPPDPVPPPEPPKDKVAMADPCDGGQIQGGLSGAGAGGGGTGEGIGLGKIGTIGSGGGTGTGAGRGTGGAPGNRPSQAPEIQVGMPTAKGKLDLAIIRRVVRRHLGEVRFCYERILQKDPRVGGVVVAKFVIGKEGAVVSATADGVHPEVASCIAARVMNWAFPKPADGIVAVVFPFTLAPP